MDFDPSTFLSQTVDEPLSTKVLLVPAGEYKAMLGEVSDKSFKTITWKDKQTNEEKSSIMFTVMCKILDADEMKAKLGRQEVNVPLSFFLDFKGDNPANGLETGEGKNVSLGRLREAVGQNGSGAWAFGRLSGAGPVMIKVGHRQGKTSDEKFAEVQKVTKLS